MSFYWMLSSPSNTSGNKLSLLLINQSSQRLRGRAQRKLLNLSIYFYSVKQSTVRLVQYDIVNRGKTLTNFSRCFFFGTEVYLIKFSIIKFFFFSDNHIYILGTS